MLLVIVTLTGGLRAAAAAIGGGGRPEEHRCGCPDERHDCDCPQCHARGLALRPRALAGPCLDVGCGMPEERAATRELELGPVLLAVRAAPRPPSRADHPPETRSAASEEPRAPEPPRPRAAS